MIASIVARAGSAAALATVLLCSQPPTVASAQSQSNSATPMQARISALIPALEGYIQSGMKAFDVPGLAIGIVAGGGRGVTPGSRPGLRPAPPGPLIGPPRGHAGPGPWRLFLVGVKLLVPGAPPGAAGFAPAACRGQPAGPGWRGSLLSHGASFHGLPRGTSYRRRAS